MRSATRNGSGRDKAYIAWLHTQRCVVGGHGCGGPIQAHHAGVRGLGQRAPDRTAISLCFNHHDRTSPGSIHSLGVNFWTLHCLDRDSVIREMNERFERDSHSH